jgi:PleD family two-component response regulator
VIGRHDGAFVVLLPGPDPLEQAERLRVAVTGEPVVTRDGPMHTSLSIGVTAHTDASAPVPAVWLKRAQAAIMTARQSGRDGVVSAS